MEYDCDVFMNHENGRILRVSVDTERERETPLRSVAQGTLGMGNWLDSNTAEQLFGNTR